MRGHPYALQALLSVHNETCFAAQDESGSLVDCFESDFQSEPTTREDAINGLCLELKLLDSMASIREELKVFRDSVAVPRAISTLPFMSLKLTRLM